MTEIENVLAKLEEDYPDNHAMDEQPEWMPDLRACHDSVLVAYARKRETVPVAQLEVQVQNQQTGETGWYRIEVASGQWSWPFDSPPAGLAAALDWLANNVDATAYRAWWEQRNLAEEEGEWGSEADDE